MGGPEVNKFEQVSSEGHQISLAGPLSDVRAGGGGLYSEVQCIMGNGHMESPLPENRKMDRHD